MYSIIYFVALVLVADCGSSKMPHSWPVCKEGPTMNDCLKNAINIAVKSLGKGMPSLGVLPIDPLHFDSLLIDQPSGAVTLKIQFEDLEIYGLENLLVKEVKGTWNRLVLNITAPVLTFAGKYNINAKIMALPLVGKGLANFTFTEHDFKDFTVDLKKVPKNGKEYYVIQNIHYTIAAKTLHMHFSNLFNGDKAMGDQMNNFLNENWKEILPEIEPSVTKAFGAAFKEVGNKILSKIPVSVITPK